MSQPRNEGFVRLPGDGETNDLFGDTYKVKAAAPAGFEKFFADLAELMSQMPPGPPDTSRIGALYGTYGLEVGHPPGA